MSLSQHAPSAGMQPRPAGDTGLMTRSCVLQLRASARPPSSMTLAQRSSPSLANDRYRHCRAGDNQNRRTEQGGAFALRVAVRLNRDATFAKSCPEGVTAPPGGRNTANATDRRGPEKASNRVE